MTLDRYYASVDIAAIEQSLANWQWLIGKHVFRVHRVTMLAHVLLIDQSGSIWHLDVTWGRLMRIGDSIDNFEAMVAADRNLRRDLLYTFLMRDVISRKPLPAGRCYSWKVPPHLGGELDEDDLEDCDAATYISVMGQLHQQTNRARPDETRT